MIFKHLPEDFYVEEVANHVPRDGPYTLYKLTKTGIGTVEALRKVIEDNKFTWHDVSWAGLKDKQAKTVQYITISQDLGEHKEYDKLQLDRIGKLDRMLSPGDLKENKFVCVLRDLSEEEVRNIRLLLPAIKLLPNYFDSQRFGSVLHNKGFIAKHLIKKEYEQALRLHIGTVGNEQDEKVVGAKAFIGENWGKWEECLKNTPEFLWEVKKVLQHLIKKPEDFSGAYRKIEKKTRVFHLFTYQSYLFNAMLDSFLRSNRSVIDVQYQLGSLAFPPKTLDTSFTTRELCLVSKKAHFDEDVMPAVQAILEEEGFETVREIKMPRKMTEIFFKANERPMAIGVKDLVLSQESDDDQFPGKKKVTVSFTLPKGAYATLVLKFLEAANAQ